MKNCEIVAYTDQVTSRSIFFILLLTLYNGVSFSQQSDQSSIWYCSFAPSITNNPGSLGAKFSPDFEIGKQWQEVFTLALDIGRTNCAKVRTRDTAWYLEFRPNLNIFQVGKFVNTFTPGVGVVLNASQYLMLEFTSGIEYCMNPKIHFNIYFGQYYFSGQTTNSAVAFVGISVARFFRPVNPHGVLNDVRKTIQ
ncbi:MAG: hypothetical protein K1X68_05720 [Saprospiraceae bacterium]|nr:hypothetical protein [Saprospiraceae bacterium]HMW39237.1 hypothetical protein [Saprospiraceae bacterium]HMX88947.1 hypothetical protein [Saprospiraceae bacterium]HMZ40154.1 hypothetical protein [Saprospiraceae bacterium]HNA64441.1 hypothetical protein [Saprospiraceae bacterium]